MRPRPDAAENTPQAARTCAAACWRFNEAAARCRGKLGGVSAAFVPLAALQ